MERHIDKRPMSPIKAIITLILSLIFGLAIGAVMIGIQYFIIWYFDLPGWCMVCLIIQIALYIISIPLTIIKFIIKRAKGD